MPKNEWQRRIERAQQLALEHAPSADILRFFAAIAESQYALWQSIEDDAASAVKGVPPPDRFAQPLPEAVLRKFIPFLSVVVEHGPAPVVQAALNLRQQEESLHAALLTACWQGASGALEPGAREFLARGFLQPYAVFVRTHANRHSVGPASCLCPFCGRKPGLGVLRPLGDGGLRSLVCSFCLGEWEFRRILCPACGEEDHAKLPVYTAWEFPYMRVECCDTCRCYIKTVDLTKSGLAEPIVDEIASIPLDLWAQQQGYAKVQANLMQL